MMSLLSIEELNRNSLSDLIDRAVEMKAERGAERDKPLAGQTWALIFTKASTRTRVSFEVGIRELGGSPLFLSKNDIQLGRGEPIKDTARVLGRMVHGAIIRTFDQQDVVDFAHFSQIPTINALTDEEHPCQILADLLTVREKLGTWDNKKIAFIGDGDNNMS
ncbi:MAG: ornithine carbamoyltransferase, partial [Verrucomicrobiales bacterium]